MKLKVLYRDDGRIVSLSRLRESSDQDESSIPSLRSGVEPQDGQRAAVVELDERLKDTRLSDIHEHFVVAEDPHGARLVERHRSG